MYQVLTLATVAVCTYVLLFGFFKVEGTAVGVIGRWLVTLTTFLRLQEKSACAGMMKYLQ
jgi:hypothetical protein